MYTHIYLIILAHKLSFNASTAELGQFAYNRTPSLVPGLETIHYILKNIIK